MRRGHDRLMLLDMKTVKTVIAAFAVILATALAGCGSSSSPPFATSSSAGSVPQGQESANAAAKLPSGQGQISLQTYGTVGPTGGPDAGQIVTGTVDGLPLTARGILSDDWSDFCFGNNGSTATGTLGGISFNVTLACGAGAGGEGPYVQTFTGEWGGQPISVTATSTISADGTTTTTTLSGTIGSQQVTATVLSSEGTAHNQVTGTMTVS